MAEERLTEEHLEEPLAEEPLAEELAVPQAAVSPAPPQNLSPAHSCRRPLRMRATARRGTPW